MLSLSLLLLLSLSLSLSHVSVAYWNNRNHNVYAIKLLTKRTSYCHVASASGRICDCDCDGDCAVGAYTARHRRRPLARRGPACQHVHKLSLIYILPCECPGCLLSPSLSLSLPFSPVSPFLSFLDSSPKQAFLFYLFIYSGSIAQLSRYVTFTLGRPRVSHCSIRIIVVRDPNPVTSRCSINEMVLLLLLLCVSVCVRVCVCVYSLCQLLIASVLSASGKRTFLS